MTTHDWGDHNGSQPDDDGTDLQTVLDDLAPTLARVERQAAADEVSLDYVDSDGVADIRLHYEGLGGDD